MKGETCKSMRRLAGDEKTGRGKHVGLAEKRLNQIADRSGQLTSLKMFAPTH